MKISTDSWHYKLNDFISESFIWDVHSGEVSLCKYFWKTVLNILTAIGGAGVGLFLISLALGTVYGVGMAFISMFALIFGYWDSSWIGYDAFLLILIGIPVAIFFGVFRFIFEKDFKFCPEYLKPKSTLRAENKKPSLIVEYYKAHKSKFCPYIEVE